jgi:acetyltransferase-like isoleucine patch superfamily enzyme
VNRDNVFIHPTAEVHASAEIGEGTKIWHLAQVRERVRIGHHCVVSKDVYIDCDVTIGNSVKIQNGVSVYKGVTLEDDVFVGPYSSFTNDIRPRAFSKDWEVIPTLLRRGCSIGANATILCGVTLGEYSMVAAGSVITEDTLPFGLYIGSPGRLKGFVSRGGFEMGIVVREPDRLVYACRETKERLTIRFEVEKG